MKKRWGITDETPTTDELVGNIHPIVNSTHKKVEVFYRKYEHDVKVEKLYIVHKKVRDCLKKISNGKNLKTRKLKASMIRNMPPKVSKRNTLKRKLSAKRI